MRLLATILILAATALAVPPAHAQDAAAGETVFKKCIACHAVGEDAKTKVGPILNGIVGRPAASIEGFSYSAAMKESGLTWDEATLTTYLHAPKALVKGTKMAFVGLKSDADIANVIAYLKQFGADGKKVAP